MFKKIFNYRIKANHFINSIRKNTDYLVDGQYIMDPLLKFAYRNDPDTIDFVENIIRQNNYDLVSDRGIKYRIKRMLIPKTINIKNNSQNTYFRGSICLFSNDNFMDKDVKVFDIHNSRILTSYVNKESLIKKIEHYEFYSMYFNIPKVIEYNFDNNHSLEDLIISKPKNCWDEFDYNRVIDKIFKSYKFYYKKSLNCNDNLEYTSAIKIIKDLKSDETLKNFADSIENELSNELIFQDIVTVKQHGDLWLYNTILDISGAVYFIDWEHSGNYGFYYDLLWWMINEAIYNDNFSYLEKFANGLFDKYFDDIFNIFKYKFNILKRKEYIYIFLLELLQKRILKESYEIKVTVLDVYSKLFDQVKNMRNR